jgi:hypothetical protein
LLSIEGLQKANRLFMNSSVYVMSFGILTEDFLRSLSNLVAFCVFIKFV